MMCGSGPFEGGETSMGTIGVVWGVCLGGRVNSERCWIDPPF